MSRGIITKQYNTLSEISAGVSSGELQYRDIAFINPISTEEKIKVYQILQNELNELVIEELKGNNSEFNDILFTDNIFIPNVTQIRKAHTDDIREIIKFLSKTTLSKYGDNLTGLFNLYNAKLEWSDNSYIIQIDESELDLSYNEAFKIKYNRFTDVLTFLSNKIQIFKNVDIISSVSITGNNYVNGNLYSTDGTDTTTISPSIIQSKSFSGENVVTNNITSEFMNIKESTNTDVVVNLNSDKLDGHDYENVVQNIISLFPNIFNFLPVPIEISPSSNGTWMDVTLDDDIISPNASSIIVLLDVYNNWRVNYTYVEYQYGDYNTPMKIVHTEDDDSRGETVVQLFLPFDNENMKFTWRWVSSGGGVRSFKILGFTL